MSLNGVSSAADTGMPEPATLEQTSGPAPPKLMRLIPPLIPEVGASTRRPALRPPRPVHPHDLRRALGLNVRKSICVVKLYGHSSDLGINQVRGR